jgi:cytochrome oxidase Cu insertion factor (SCO1/SenC/PrrC family)
MSQVVHRYETKPMIGDLASNSNSNSIININNKSKTNTSRTNSLTSSARVKILKLPNAGGNLRFEDPRYKAAKLKKQRKQDIQRRFNHDSSQNQVSKNTISSKRSVETNNDHTTNYRVSHCHMTFIFDPNGRFSYWMGNDYILLFEIRILIL